MLRDCRESDAEAIYEAAIESMDHVSKWMPWLTPEYSIETATSWVRAAAKEWVSETRFEFVIIDSENNRLCGVCGLNQLDEENRICNLGYWVRKSELCKGVASAAVRILKVFGIKTRKLDRLEIVVAISNTDSRKVAEKSNAIYEGIQRKRLRVGETSFDAHMYALIDE